jgi:hypothetical protein
MSNLYIILSRSWVASRVIVRSWIKLDVMEKLQDRSKSWIPVINYGTFRSFDLGCSEHAILIIWYLTFTDKYNLLKNERMFAVKCGPAVDVFIKTGLKV